jgi:glycerol-3-phosphate acyltransferase PlsY
MLPTLFGITISYLIGSMPTAYIFGRLLKGVDIRKFGSGNVGATNAFRVLGKGPGIAVLIIDMFKGFITTDFVGNIVVLKTNFISDETLRIILGLSCICGHNWTIFLRFKGGKGVATTFGVLIGLAMKIAGLKIILALVILTWLITFIITRIVSISSFACGVSLPIYMILFKQSGVLVLLSIVLSTLIVLRHRSNLKRFLEGKEPRLNFRKS